MDLLKFASGIGENAGSFLRKKKKDLEDVINGALNAKAQKPGAMSVREQVAKMQADPQFAERYDLFKTMKKTNLPGVSQAGGALDFGNRSVVAPLVKGGGDALRYAAFAGIQTPVAGLTQGKVNIPIYNQKEIEQAAGRGNEDVATRATKSFKSSFNKFFVPAANIATVAKAPVNAAIGATIGASGKVIENLQTGKRTNDNIGAGVEEGIKNSWIIALSNGVTNKVLGKIAPKLTDEALAVTWAGAKSAKALATTAGQQIARGVLETPAEAAGFTAWDVLAKDKDFKTSLEKNLIDSLVGNIAFHGGTSAVRIGAKGLQSAIQKAITKSVTARASELGIKADAKSAVDNTLDVAGSKQKVDQLIDAKKSGKTFGQLQQERQSPDLTKYENALNDGDWQILEGLAKKHPGEMQYQVHKNMDMPNLEALTTTAKNRAMAAQLKSQELIDKAKKFVTSPEAQSGKINFDAKIENVLKTAGDTNVMSKSDIARAKAKLAGIEVRNRQRTAGNLKTPQEVNPFTQEQMKQVEGTDVALPKSENLYHTTRPGNLTSIQEKGLLTGQPKRQDVSSPNDISLATTEEAAKYYGADNDVLLRTKKGWQPKTVEPDLLAGGSNTAIITKDTVPPEALEVKVGDKWIPLAEYKNTPTAASKKDLAEAYRSGKIKLEEAISLGYKPTGETTSVKDLLNKTKRGAVGEAVDQTTDFTSDLGQKPRGFPQTVKTNIATPDAVANVQGTRPEDFYAPLSNKETTDYVQKNILSKGEDYALTVAKSGKDTNANATAMMLLDKYIKTEEFDKANTLIKDVSPRFTEQGQQVQILSLYGRMTPSGSIKFAQKLVNEANESLPAGRKIELTRENIKEISDLAAKVQKIPDGTRERTVASAQLLDKIASQVPPSLGQKLSTIQTMAQLLNPKTLIRNTVGNVAFAGLENTKDVVATGIDKLVSLKTGKRTKVLPSLVTQAVGLKEGFQLGLEDALKGIDTGGFGTKYDLPNVTFREGFLGGAEKALNVSLRATDRAAYTAARNESLRQQMVASGATKPNEDMVKQAHIDGLYRTFQDDTKLAAILSGFKKLLNKPTGGEFGLGDLVIKYPRTPANLMQRAIDYTPAGLLGAATDIFEATVRHGDFNQRHFVESLSRAATGTGIIALGYTLGKAGIVTGQASSDSDINATARAIGEGAFKFNVDAMQRWVTSGFDPEAGKPKPGDFLMTYDWNQPVSFMLSMGANAAKPTKGNDALTVALDSLAAAEEGLTNQPLVQNLLRYPSNIKNYGFTEATVRTVAGLPASFVPSTINQIGQFSDNTGRETYDPNPIVGELKKAIARIPGARQTLQPRITTTGEVQEQFDEEAGGNNFFNVFFNPAFVSRYKADPELQEVLDINKRSGETQQAPRIADKKIKINGEELALSPEQYTQYQTYLGQKSMQLYRQTIGSPAFEKMNDEEKAKELSGILTDVNAAAKIELFGNNPKNMSKRSRRLVAEGWKPGGGRGEGLVGTANADTGRESGSSADVDRYMKAYELDKLIQNDTKGITKYKNQQKALEEARKIVSGDEGYEGVPENVKDGILEKMGLGRGDVEYDILANEDHAVRLPYIREQLDAYGDDHQAVLTNLYEGREVSIGGKQVVSNSVVDDLYEEGYISKAERAQLKKTKLGQNGKVIAGAATGAGTKSKDAKVNVNDLIKALKDQPKISQGGSTKITRAPALAVPRFTADTDVRPDNLTLPEVPSVQALLTRRPTAGSNVARARQLVARVGGENRGTGRSLKLSQSYYRGRGA